MIPSSDRFVGAGAGGKEGEAIFHILSTGHEHHVEFRYKMENRNSERASQMIC